MCGAIHSQKKYHKWKHDANSFSALIKHVNNGAYGQLLK